MPLKTSSNNKKRVTIFTAFVNTLLKKSPLYFKGIKAAAIDIYLKDGKHVLLESVCDI